MSAEIRTTPDIGLRQPTAENSVGEGCTMIDPGKAIPGIRSVFELALANTKGVADDPHPLIFGYLVFMTILKWP